LTKKIVVPGELVTEERKRMGQNVYLREGKIFSKAVGFVSENDTTASVVALKGKKYAPQEGDVIVGIVASEKFSVYEIDINSYYSSFVSKRDFRESLKVNTFISAKVLKVNELNEATLTNIRVLYGGDVFSVSPVKVPRIIGRNGSMLEVLKNGTNCPFFVGKNGKIWVKCDDPSLLKKTVNMICEKAHEENLTESIKNFLEKEMKNNKKGE
jgi:exosome complex component RRP4